MIKNYIASMRHVLFSNLYLSNNNERCFCSKINKFTLYCLFIILMIFWVINPYVVCAQNWVYLVKSDDGEQLFYDSDSVKYLPDNIVQVTVKVDDSRIEAGSEYSPKCDTDLCKSKNEAYKNAEKECFYETHIYELKCSNYRFREVFGTYYDKKGNIVCKDYTKYEWLNGYNFDDMTMSLFQKFCK